MSSRFFTNQADQTLLRKFRGVFESNPDIEWFDALVGYLRASGYFAIRPFLNNVPHIRILVGINVDAIMADYQRRGLLFMPDPTKALEEFKNDLRKDIQGAAYSKETENGILQFVEDVASKKISIRAHPTQRLHAKLYIFRQKGFNEHKPGAVITGSSNLTAAGLGTTEEVTNGSLHKVKHPERFDLVIVDEAHKFRNDTAEAFDELQRICKTPTQRGLPGGGHDGRGPVGDLGEGDRVVDAAQVVVAACLAAWGGCDPDTDAGTLDASIEAAQLQAETQEVAAVEVIDEQSVRVGAGHHQHLAGVAGDEPGDHP